MTNDIVVCLRCNGALDANLRCAGCGSRFVLVDAEPQASTEAPADPLPELLRALVAAQDDRRREAVRRQLSLVLAQQDRRDLLVAIWYGHEGPEADLWRGVAAAQDPLGTETDSLELLERVHHASVKAGRDTLAAFALTYLGKAYVLHGRYAEARAVDAAALANAIERRNPWGIFRAAYSTYYSLSFLRLSDPLPAVRELPRLADVVRALDPSIGGLLDLTRALVLLHTIERREGLALLDRALQQRPIAYAHDRYLRLSAQLLVAAQEGDTDSAGRLYAEWQGWLRHLGDRELAQRDSLLEAETALALGDPRRARTVLERSSVTRARDRTYYQQRDARMLWAEVLAHEALGAPRARRRRAAAQARGAADRSARRALSWHELRWRVIASDLYRAAQRPRECRVELERVVRLADRMALPRFAEPARRQLRALGAGEPRGARRDERVPMLTRRQGEIAALVAQGATNRDIATHLRISEVTVARHVSSALFRLDLPNRRALGQAYRSAEHHETA